MKKDYCMTLVSMGAEPLPVAHIHVEAENSDDAMLGLLAVCVKENISVVGCRVVVATDIDIPEGLAAYTEKARELNHGTRPPPMYCDPGSLHLH